jgi:hypothetical protein
MKLSEAMEVQTFGYGGTRPDYEINDNHPSVLIIDKDYNIDGNGKSVLGFNLNYLDSMSQKEKRRLVSKVNKVDNKIQDLNAIKSWLRSILNAGDYEISGAKKLKRYKEVVKKFPELKKAIRRYKYTGIEGRVK